MALFYGVYRVFMEKETNYTLNRFYLVGTLILSLVLPILPLENLFAIRQNLGIPVYFIGIEDQGISATGIEVSSSSGSEWRLDGISITRILYLGGIALFLSILLSQFLRLVSLPSAGRENYGPLKVIFTHKNISPFSILNRVFVNQEIRKNPKMQTILDHEYAHFKHLHFIDLLLLEFIIVFQWFNPFTWLYVRSLNEIHEYQADAAVLRSGEMTGNYQALLVNQLTGTEVFRLSSGFSKSLTKKRMIMMTKIKSKNGVWLKSLIAVPLLAILLIAFSANSSPVQNNQESLLAQGNLESSPVQNNQETYTISGKVVESVTGEAMPGTSVIWKGTTTGTVTDRKGEFKLEVNDKNAVLIFSFVGYKSISAKGIGKDHLIKMRPEIIEIPEGYVEPAESKEKASNAASEKDQEINTLEASKEIFFVVEDMPKFQGKSFESAQPYLQEHAVYPPSAKEKKIQGKVYVEFQVGSKGEIKNSKVVRSVDPALDKAALNAVNAMPAWKPGIQRGKPVTVQFTVPVVFDLGDE